MKKISLLVILWLTLIVPFAANADTKSSDNQSSDNQISQNNDHENEGGTSFKGLSERDPYVMTKEGSDSFTYRNLTESGKTDSFFSITEGDTHVFSASVSSDDSSTRMTPTLIDVSTGKTVALNHEGNYYTYSGLVSGHEYDFEVNYTVSPHSSATVYTTVAVAAVPEPKQWGMMVTGLLLIATKVKKAKKSANTQRSVYA